MVKNVMLVLLEKVVLIVLTLLQISDSIKGTFKNLTLNYLRKKK